ncbi:DNA repair protein RecN [Treponema sp. J25]|uniref:DNA repair protein RecN n=1 Tax=Treponema sp. J25 TaxID=2094121 RepID=UPI00104E32E7|nr:DNA repair protein RecN [Treponema sp. J25]TCW61987.1 DNA repair protein RecN [Treponema sp. J25]
MLEELIIQDYALIDTLHISFEGGLNILTGETGAGKSIIVGALGFILGSKVDTDIIRTGREEVRVSAILGVDPRNTEALNWLTDHGIEPEEGKVILRRNLKQNGRGSMFIQNVPVTRNDLADFTSLLFDIHGQHEHQLLLKRESHRRYLDRFAGIEEEVLQFNRVFTTLSEKRKLLENSRSSERDRQARMEMLSYAIEEIEKARLRIGESEELEQESRRMGAHEKLASYIETACELLFEGDASCLASLRRVRSSLEGALSIDSTLAALAEGINSTYYDLEDWADQLRTYRNNLTFDPRRLEEIEERLALLYRLKKKYGATEEEILGYKQKAEEELDHLAHFEENRAALEAEIASLEREVIQRARSITQKREKAAEELSVKITAILASLGMNRSRFAVSVLPKTQGSDSLLCGPYGAEDIEFFISPNPGEPLKELSRIASGGELSRVMLAIKTILAHSDTVETLVFDEIDTGIGGEVALAVGEHLAQLGRIKQIFCITHLASIAVRADNHLKVEKSVVGDRTVTTVRPLSDRERKEEIARMLSGDASAGVALAHAEELLARYRGLTG